MTSAAALRQSAAGAADSMALRDVLTTIATPSSRSGAEAEMAEAVASWLRREPAVEVRLQEVAPGRANLLATSRGTGQRDRALWFYTHLDTSLSGNPALDYPLTGTRQLAHDLQIDHGMVSGLGLAVSKGPLACAVTALRGIAAALDAQAVDGTVGLLLAVGGTHRAHSGGFDTTLPAGLDQGLGLGVGAALGNGCRPDAVVNVKGGASGVLSEEPGCLLLRIEVRDPMVAMPARGPSPGAAVRAAQVALLVERWRAEHVAVNGDVDRQTAREVGVGAIESGLPYKPDILPGVANVYVYLVIVPGDDGEALAAHLEEFLRRGMADDGRYDPDQVQVHVLGGQAGAATPEDRRIVRIARHAWDRRHGQGSSEVRGYRGSTDGVIFRAAGIDTVRLGPTAVTDPSQPNVERVSFAELQAFVELYIEIATDYLTDEAP